MLKIYPTLVVEGTALYHQYKMGKYTSLRAGSTNVELLCDSRAKYLRGSESCAFSARFPREEIAVGAKAGNLRQLVLDEMARRNLECHCIRCREVGHRKLDARE